MKNLKFSLILLFPICAFAQWTPSPYTSGNISFLTGNVGIGKTANNNKLVVLGTTSLEGSLLISNSFSLSRSNISGMGYTTLFQAYGSNPGDSWSGDNIRIEAAQNVYAGDLELRGGFSEFGSGGNVSIIGGQGILTDDLIDVQGIDESQGGDVSIQAGNSVAFPGNVSINAGYGDGILSSHSISGHFGDIKIATQGGTVTIGSSASASPVKMSLGYGNFSIGKGDINVVEGTLIVGSGYNKNALMSFKRSTRSYSIYQGSDSKWHFANQASTDSIATDIMVITYANNIGIGTAFPDSKLTVKGNIHTQEVKVDLNGAVAPDYVFDKNYDLKPLAEVEKYIEQNKHLPEVPSGTEMDQNGVNLKEMNLLLLKKIEELTLHLIEQDKAIRKLSTEVNKLKGDQ